MLDRGNSIPGKVMSARGNTILGKVVLALGNSILGESDLEEMVLGENNIGRSDIGERGAQGKCDDTGSREVVSRTSMTRVKWTPLACLTIESSGLQNSCAFIQCRWVDCR